MGMIVNAAQAGDEVNFDCADCAFGGVAAM
jgi:hypothetical protein